MSPPSTTARVAAALLFIALSGGTILVATTGFAPSEDGPTLCPFRHLTGLPCPLCGMTRASFRLLRGDLAGALRMHPCAPLWFAMVGGGVAFGLGSVVAGRWPRWPRTATVIALSLLALSWLAKLSLGGVAR